MRGRISNGRERMDNRKNGGWDDFLRIDVKIRMNVTP